MKKIFLILSVLMFISVFSTNAQYRYDKKKYDTKGYKYQKGDYRHPLLCGAASIIYPGVGQIVAGETLRGLLFAGGFTASYGSFLLAVGTDIMAFYALGMAGLVVIPIWSVFDAIKVAKVKNLAVRDKTGLNYSLSIIPCYFSNPGFSNQQHFGVSLNLNF